MSKFSLIVSISAAQKKTAIEAITKEYSKATINQIGKKDSELRYLIKLNTPDTKEIIETTLNKISDVSVIGIESEPNILFKLPRKFSTWLMVGLIIGWVTVSYIAFQIPNNFIDNFSNSQLLVLQISIALIISIWIFFYDKKIQEDIVDVLAKLDLRTSEINENVKELKD